MSRSSWIMKILSVLLVIVNLVSFTLLNYNEKFQKSTVVNLSSLVVGGIVVNNILVFNKGDGSAQTFQKSHKWNVKNNNFASSNIDE